MALRPVLLPARRSAAEITAVLAGPHVRAVVLTSLLARLPKGMLPLATVLLLHRLNGSYAIAGLAAALVAAGDAATTPVQGRLIDRYGRARVLLPTAATHGIAVAALLLLVHRNGPIVAVVLTAALAGVGMPPVSGSIKALWSELVPAEQLHSAYALESLLQQAFFLAGPLLVAACTALGGPQWALIASAVLLLTGTAGFVIAAAPVRPVAGRTQQRGALGVGMVRVLLLSTVLQSTTFGILPVGLVAVSAAAAKPGLAGVLQATLTIGGLAGTFAGSSGATRRQYVRLVGAFAGLLTPVALAVAAPAPLGLAVAGLGLIASGLLLTPLAAAGYLLIQRNVPRTGRTEAFAWLSTGQAIGNAVGAALAGILTDRVGTMAAVAAAPLLVGAAAGLTWLLWPEAQAARC